MPFTYSEDPTSSPKDALRFAIGDTRACTSLLSDAELLYILAASNGNLGAAAVRATEAMISRCNAMVDETVGSVSRSFSQRLANLTKQRDMLAAREFDTGASPPICGGLTYSDKRRNLSNPDMVRPRFVKADTCEPTPETYSGASGLYNGAGGRFTR